MGLFAVFIEQNNIVNFSVGGTFASSIKTKSREHLHLIDLNLMYSLHTPRAKNYQKKVRTQKHVRKHKFFLIIK